MRHIAIAIALTAIILATIACGSTGSATPAVTQQKTKAPTVTPTPDPMMACVMAQGFMEKYLKAPATAKWGPCYGDGVVTLKDDGTYLVASYVDSQNSFGAMLRQQWAAQIRPLPNDKWRLLSLIAADLSTGELQVLYTSPPEETPVATTTSATQPAPAQAGPRANTGANLRAGPGTNYAKTGGVPAGQALNIVARNPAGDWLQLASGAWIFANLVDGAPADLPVANAIPAAPAAPAAATPVARGLPTAAGSTCDCDHGNTLNCDDFSDIQGWDAQACYLRCKELKGADVHGLDRDNDGSACEWKY